MLGPMDARGRRALSSPGAGEPTGTGVEPAAEPLSGFEAARGEWTQLAERAANLFATWEWASTWWRHFGRDRPLRLFRARHPDGSLAAILPLYQAARSPLRIVRFVGHGPADQLGPVAAPDDRAVAARALRRTLESGELRADLLLTERLPGDEGWAPALAPAAVLRRESSPVIRIAGLGWEDFLASRSSNFRGQVRRRERKLVRDHALELRLSDDPERLPADFETFLSLHAARWGRESGAFGETRRAFHREFAARALERGWLRLWLAEVGGRTIAAWYGFRYGDAEWYYQAGRDPAWEESSVGFVLLSHTVREAFEARMREYRLLLGDEPYKERFATEDPGLETLGLAGTRRGRAALTGVALAEHLPGRAGRVSGGLIDRSTRR